MMSEYIPTTDRVVSYIRGNAVMAGANAAEANQAADAWLAEVERADAEKALGAVKASIWAERTARETLYPDEHYGGMVHAYRIVAEAMRRQGGGDE